jgi:hypothetical protein
MGLKANKVARGDRHVYVLESPTDRTKMVFDPETEEYEPHAAAVADPPPGPPAPPAPPPDPEPAPEPVDVPPAPENPPASDEDDSWLRWK